MQKDAWPYTIFMQYALHLGAQHARQEQAVRYLVLVGAPWHMAHLDVEPLPAGALEAEEGAQHTESLPVLALPCQARCQAVRCLQAGAQQEPAARFA